MNFNHPNKGGSTIVVRTVCAIVFLTFSFLWLRFFQSDVLAVAQHVLSGGQTHYHPLVGALLITGALFLLQLLVYSLTRLKKLFHALTYLPSMLVLAIISDISSDIDLHFSMGAWWIVLPLVLAVWVALVIAARRLQRYEQGASGLFSRRVWVNLATMALLIIGVAAVSNTNAVFHFRAHAEVSLNEGNIDEALLVGSSSHETDVNLTMLRIYALSRKGQLGERLFSYPIVGGSNAMLPVAPLPSGRFFAEQSGKAERGGGLPRTILLPADSIFRYLGAIPKEPMSTLRYLHNLESHGLSKPPVADYMLCAHLIDRNLDAFVQLIGQYYDLEQELPRHYREALTLYTHLRAHPALVRQDNVMEEDYADLQRLEAAYSDLTERKVRVAEKYADSYWYYYEYMNQ